MSAVQRRMLAGDIGEALNVLALMVADAAELPLLSDDEGPLASELYPHLCYRSVIPWAAPTADPAGIAWPGVVEFDVVTEPNPDRVPGNFMAENIRRIIEALPRHTMADGVSMEFVDIGVQYDFEDTWCNRSRVVAGILVRGLERTAMDAGGGVDDTAAGKGDARPGPAANVNRAPARS